MQTDRYRILIVLYVRSLLKALVAEAVAKQFCHGRVAYFARTRAALARVVRSISTVTGVDRWAFRSVTVGIPTTDLETLQIYHTTFYMWVDDWFNIVDVGSGTSSPYFKFLSLLSS